VKNEQNFKKRNKNREVVLLNAENPKVNSKTTKKKEEMWYNSHSSTIPTDQPKSFFKILKIT